MYYSYINNKFEKNWNADQTVIHFEMDGDTVLKNSDEFNDCEEVRDRKDQLLKETINKFELMDSNHKVDLVSARRIMKNKFNFNQRMCQTAQLHTRELCVSTRRPVL